CSRLVVRAVFIGFTGSKLSFLETYLLNPKWSPTGWLFWYSALRRPSAVIGYGRSICQLHASRSPCPRAELEPRRFQVWVQHRKRPA
ncbi:hypothetical protein T265_12270, partial [Opisthorchis viverrini]